MPQLSIVVERRLCIKPGCERAATFNRCSAVETEQFYDRGTRWWGRGAGSASPPYPSGALQERYARKGGGTRGWVRGRTTTSGLHACTHAPGSAPHCCGSRCTAVGSVAATCRLLASFLSFAAGGFGGGGEGGDWRLLVFDFIFSRRGCGALAFVARGATPESFAAGGAHAPLCLLNFLGSSRTLGVVSRSA